ncbi:MAG: selenium cofactor biosynthesis protein YqeC [Tissierellia bacterium]|nr:selenium cofactor biosynthesis protein YqeC [Tissierellia bacterium]
MEENSNKGRKENRTKDIKVAWNINKGELISLVGMGGKTTALFTLGERLKEDGSVLLSTTTKLGYPLRECENLHFYGSSSQFFDAQTTSLPNLGIGKGDVFFVAGEVTSKKIVGLEKEELDRLIPYFDYTILEADGSRKYMLKAWREYEPVIHPKTTMTIGILSVDAMGKRVDESLVMNFPLFLRHYGKRDRVDGPLIEAMVQSPQGMFQYAKGKKKLFINGCEREDQLETAHQLSEYLKERLDVEVLYGSLKEGMYVY